MDNQLSVPVKTALSSLRESGLGLAAPYSSSVLVAEHARIAGTAHHGNSDDVLASLEMGTRLKLQREPSNHHDPWCIRFMAPGGRTIGYMPADVNEVLARLMDAGKRLYAQVCDKDETGAWVKVFVDVFLDD